MRITLLLLAFTLAACAAPRPDPVPAPAVAPPIAPEHLRRDVFVFASDSFLGRETGTVGELRAVRFLTERLAARGLQPAGDSGYLQRVPLVRQALGPGTRLAVVADRDTTTIQPGAALLPLVTLGPGAPLPRLRAEGDIVFAGYGISIPELGRNDLAGLDVRGKVVVVVNDAPPGVDSARRVMLSNQQMIGQRLQALIPQRPAAVIVLVGGAFGEEFAEHASELLSTVTLEGMEPEPRDEQRVFPMIMMGALEAGSPLLPAGWPADDRPQALTGRRFIGNVDLLRDRIFGYNVIAQVRGSDPVLAETYVAFGAHLDHIGVQPPETDDTVVNGEVVTLLDSIANGADDDASGSMTLLAIAEAMQARQARLRRSVLFVWHTAEEKGLFGSQYFVEHPTVPRDSIVAQLNADMIGRNPPGVLYIVGPGAAPNEQSRVLGTIVDSVNAALPTPFDLNREWDTQIHPERIYYRSDHYSYAQYGIPIVFFTTGLHDDYHKVTDEPAELDYQKMARVGQLLYEIGAAVANRPTRPR